MRGWAFTGEGKYAAIPQHKDSNEAADHPADVFDCGVWLRKHSLVLQFNMRQCWLNGYKFLSRQLPPYAIVQISIWLQCEPRWRPFGGAGTAALNTGRAE
jgi:hypothetical protein